MKNTTLLIQGKLNEDTYRFYCHFYRNVPKVFSTWKKSLVREEWREWPFEHMEKKSEKKNDVLYVDKNNIVVENETPPRFYERQNFDLQLISTVSGLRYVETEYVVKLRGDEWYSNLETAEEMVLGQDKIFFAPIFFRSWKDFPFHIGDHLIWGKTPEIKTMFYSCLKAILKDRVPVYDKLPEGFIADAFVAESMLGKCYLDSKEGRSISFEEGKAIFKKNFSLIPLDMLKLYKVRTNFLNANWYSNFYCPNSIYSMEDL